jgi:hypothetical protein
MPYIHPLLLRLPLLISCLLCKTLLADSYYVVDLGELEFSKPVANTLDFRVSSHAWSAQQIIQFPQLMIQSEDAEAYVGFPEQEDTDRNRWSTDAQSSMRVALRLPEKKLIRGKARLPKRGEPLIEVVDFTFDPSALEEVSEDTFNQVRRSHYQRLAMSTAPGGHLFNHLAGDIKESEGRPRSRANGSFESTFEMFSGNRAVSENLALDRELILASKVEGALSPISSISGVTVNAIDWSERLNESPTAIDPLASEIPHDQHVVFFDSIKSLNQTLKAVESDGLTLLQSFQNRGQYSKLANRYQQQLGLLIPDIIAEQLPVEGVAITGSDPFLPSGSDVAVLFKTKNPKVLFEALHALIQTQAKLQGAEADANPLLNTGTTRAYISADRSFSSIVFAGDNYVAVTNSPVQFQRLMAVGSGKLTALGATEEFKFFRQRYPLDEDETAFVFLSDATIRRWSGPAFRIGASRRVRAAAVLGKIQAQLLAKDKPSDKYADLVGVLQIKDDTVRSPIYNTLAFLTPLSELEIDRVTPTEKQAYEGWRRGYESGWVVFDPIALQIKISESSHKIDLSVIPLRIGSRYEDWIELAGDAMLDRTALNPHTEALAMASFAIDSSSELFQMANMQSQSMLPGAMTNPLAWIGESFSIYADTDPFWQAMSAQEDAEDYMEANIAKLPIGIRISSKSATRLALFLTGLRSFSQQAAPGLLIWETKEHEEQPYVVINTKEDASLGDMDIKIHYAALPDAFLLSLNEDVLKRAISRNLADAKAESTATPEQQYHAFAKIQLAVIPQYLSLLGEDPLKTQQVISWSALPVLNEWHTRYPLEDPVALHAKYFHEQIHCPGGEGYQWNESSQSMESIAFGTPENPRGEITVPLLLQNWIEAKTALSFEDDGLRLKAELTR